MNIKYFCSLTGLSWLLVPLLAPVATPMAAMETRQGAALRARVTQEVIRKFSPQVTFHYLERFFPASIEALLVGARRYEVDGPPAGEESADAALARNLRSRNPDIPIKSPSDLANLGTNWRIRFSRDNPKVKDGEVEKVNGTPMVTAPMYVFVRVAADGAFVDLVYRFLFGFNGPQSIHANRPMDFNFTLPALAEHDGDWEGVIVRLAPDLTTPLCVITEAHGNTSEFGTEQVDWVEKTHPVIASAVNSHATYNPHRNGETYDVVLDNLLAGSVIDAISTRGTRWQPWKLPASRRPFRLTGKTSRGMAGDQPWATFQGRMGTYKDNRPGMPCDANGGALANAAQKVFATSVATGVETFKPLVKKVKEDLFLGAPCGGPGGRGDMNLEIPGLTSFAGKKKYAIYSRVNGGNALVLSINPGDDRGGLTLSPYRKGDPAQCWYLKDLGNGFWIVNEKTGMEMCAHFGQGKQVTQQQQPVASDYTVWTFSGNRTSNCYIRPRATETQNLNVFGNGPYRAGSVVGTWESARGAANETWRVIEQ